MASIGLGFKNESQSSHSYLPVQKKWITDILNLYGPQAGGGTPVYGGTRVAGLTPEQQEAMNVEGWSSYLQPGNMPGFANTGQALSGLLSGEMGAEPYTQESVNTLFDTAYAQPAKKQWSEDILPGIKESYSGPGYWSSSRMDAERRGARDLSDWLGEQYGSLTWNADQSNKAVQEAKAGRALAALEPSMAYSMLPTNQATAAIQGRGALYGLATPEQQQYQTEINAAIQKFAEENQITDPQVLNVMLALLGMNYSRSEGSSSGFDFGLGTGSK